MDGTAVKQIQDTLQTISFGLSDDYTPGSPVTLFSKPVHRMPGPVEARAETLVVASLQAIIDYVSSSRIDVEDHAKTVHVHVEGYDSVKIISSLVGVNRKRESFVHARCESAIGPTFSFGKYYDVEELVIAVQTLFAPGDSDQDKLLKLFSALTNESVRTDGDDGVTQVVSTRKGITLTQDQRVPNPVALRPWRTFREVLQPVSPFILRLKSVGPDKPPQAALFEADGGCWKLDAIKRIKEFLQAKLDGSLILG